jgi:hypothetical protein
LADRKNALAAAAQVAKLAQDDVNKRAIAIDRAI